MILANALPSLPWGTFFGEPYLELFGKARVLGTPAFRVEELHSALVYVQLTERVLDCAEDRAHVEAVRRGAIEHLDANAFRGRPRDDGSYNVPSCVVA